MARFFINRPVFAIVTAIVLTLVGCIAGINLPIAQYPQITLPTVRVSAFYPGASAGVVEEAVAQPIEEQVNGVEGMLNMTSSSSGDGGYNLDITFGLDSNADIAAVQVQNRVSQANARLPAEVISSGLTTQKQTPDVLMYVALVSPKGSYDELFLTNYATINIVDVLKRIKGVGNVQVFGSEYGMRIWLKPDRMAALGLTPTDVYNAVNEQNAQAPAGQVGQLPAPKTQQFQYSVQLRGRLTETEEFGNIIVRAKPDGSFIRLRDVARTELGSKYYNFLSRFNGQPGAAFSINLTPDASAIETAGLINARLKELEKTFPADMKIETVLDNTVFVKASLKEVVSTFAEALVLVLVVVFLFLQNWRATAIPMLAVPVSLVGTFAAFTLLGFTINTLTMFGMVLAIGIVVDDAIVVVEAVEHHMEHGLNPRDATIKAMEEVSGPVVAIAMILAAVFVPVAFLGGIAGIMYKQFAITVAVSTMLSAFVALSLTPALCCLMLKPKVKRDGRLARFFTAFNDRFGRLTEGYGQGVQILIRRSLLALAMLAILIFAAVALMKKVPGGFVPPEDQGGFISSIQLPPAASLNRTEVVAARYDEALGALPGVEKRLVINGFNVLNGAPQSDSALVVVKLKPWEERRKPTEQLGSIIDSVYAMASKFPEATILAFNPPAIPGFDATGGFSFKLQDRSGNTPQELAAVAERFMEAARKRPEIGNIYSKFDPNTPAYRLEVDREKAKKLGVPVSDITNALQTFLGGLNINDFSRFGRSYKVTMQAEPEYRSDIEGIQLFHVRSSDGTMVPLSTLVTSQPTNMPTVIQRYNLYRTAELGGDPAAGYSSGDAIAAMEAVAREVLPQGYGFEWAGISQQEKESSGKAPVIFGMAIIFVFLFLAALYESWTVPFAVLFAVPLGIFGAMLGLWMAGLTNNIYAQIGLVLLIGLAAKNAILIIEFAKMRRDAGESATDAAIYAAKLRLRPIIMTSFAFILGVVPLILASGAGAASRVSMGVTVFAGMIAATLLAIFMVPVLFVTVERVVSRFARKPDATPETQP
ncbi:hydrophobe/amphiphile efflux-1 (HAE1) family protein [Formivibrio citricus]|uniref:Efflux pump membrane transporter n=1 Tax=Formivibrio citricus TaxID=83765 RepID=A0A1I4V369_9NEIS|nr:multidrug efflux RND transporter permease subunit [Formivibrio citricus]SFM95704.1 hydrophobe/amphiphile efflux-1 (HAE1) family protein [Formivibrio citricus]